jgi:hypothetical protein
MVHSSLAAADASKLALKVDGFPRSVASDVDVVVGASASSWVVVLDVAGKSTLAVLLLHLQHSRVTQAAGSKQSEYSTEVEVNEHTAYGDDWLKAATWTFKLHCTEQWM